MLEVEVKAGGHVIGHMEIERIDLPGNDHDSWFTYIAKLQLHNTDTRRFRQVVHHRYGDEWPALVHTALSALMANTLGQKVRRV